MTENTVSAVPGINFDSLLGKPETNPIQATTMEKQLATVTPEDAAAATVEEATFSFRSLLGEDQRKQLVAAAPRVSSQMVQDPTQILQFGAPVMERMNSAASKMLDAQKDIEIPEAEHIVNNLLREMDGFQAKYKNAQIEEGFAKIKNMLKGVKYSFTSMVRDSKPIAEKLDLAAAEMQKMELKLRDNQLRGKELHSTILETMDDVVAVLATLEQVIEVTREEALIAGNALEAAEKLAGANASGLAMVEYKGEQVSISELRETHAQIAQALSQLEMSWADWRTQFFLGYAQAPSVRNIALVSSTMERRCYVFRTMAVPSAKMTLAAWQQAALAKEAGEKGKALSDGANKFTQDAFRSMGETVRDVAMESQTLIINEDTIFSIVDSIKVQCEGLVAADKWGREQRAKNLSAIQAGEKQIASDFSNSRKEMVKNAIAGTSVAAQDEAPLPEADVLAQLGVK